MSEITVILEATEPMELMRGKTPYEVWMRNLGTDHTYSSHWDEIEIRGESGPVQDFIALHWGEDVNAEIMNRMGIEY